MSTELRSKLSKKLKSLAVRRRNLKQQSLPLHYSTPLPLLTTTTTTSDKFLEVFNHLDRNCDGKISVEELRYLLNSSTTSTSAETVMRDFDGDGDGLLDYEDFKKLVSGDEDDHGEQLKMVFEEFEGERGSGYITVRGLQRVMEGCFGKTKYSSEECEAMIRAYDLDGNGVLDYNEFQNMMTMT